MRISTLSIYDQSVSAMHRQQNDFIKVGQQIASGRRVVKPSDDPQAASRAVGVSQAKAITEQYTDARVSARNALAQEEGVLHSVGQALTRAKTLLVQGASDTLSDVDRASLASELKGVLETVLGQANATDGNGRYLFGGYQDGSEPFVRNAEGKIEYVGDDNQRQQRIDSSRLLDVGDNGETVFQTVHSSAGYLAKADPDNKGDLVFKGPLVVDVGDPDYGDRFELSFSDVAGTLHYSLNGAPPEPYTPEQDLNFGGLSLELSGTPADGDVITLDRADEMDPDVFAALEAAIAVLETPADSATEKAHRRNTLSTVMRELDNGMDNIFTVRASVGARLNELDTVDVVAEKRQVNYEQTLSDLVDLDYVEAIAEYSRRQIGLQAAQKTFVDISKLSLFSLL